MKQYFKSIAFLLLVVPMFLFADDAATVANPAQETANAIQTLTVGLDTLWVLVAGMLVFFMNAGFALVESGFAQSKNTVNILAKNFIVFAAATFSYWAIGWGLMFGDGSPF